MDDLNQVAIAGRLTRDPQLRTTRNGTTICSLRVACNKMFFNIKVWGDPGRELAAKSSKGDVVQVEGRLDWYEWSPGDGPRREYVGVVANDTPGSVQCIASGGGPSVGMPGDVGQGMGFPQMPQMPQMPAMNGVSSVQDITSSIAAQSQRVDFGLGAPAGPNPGAMPGFPSAPVAQDFTTQSGSLGGGVLDAPVAVDFSAAGFDGAQATGSAGFPVTPAQQFPAPGVQEFHPAQAQEFSVSPAQEFSVAPAQEFSAPPSQGFPISSPAPSMPAETVTVPQINPTHTASATAPPVAQQNGIVDPGAYQVPSPQITAQAFQAATEPVAAQADVSGFAAPESQSSAVALAEPDLAIAELGHDPNDALAMDPENEIIEEDNRFL